ncbi:MAG TPA: L-threonylcarbamoyladenylate synthase [Thermomicrobiales bacterium]|nr:L-threonylcarbamoyladenylate synthase [Thermomicrobiales bacterium]
MAGREPGVLQGAVVGRLHGREAIRRAAGVLDSGGVVAIPTDTVYGLAASLSRPDALDRVYEIKGRPQDRPLPVLLAAMDYLDQVAVVPEPPMRDLLTRFWPGGLTVALPARAGLPGQVLAPDGTVGVRVPAHPVTVALLHEAGGALAVTSANRSGHDPGLNPQDVLTALGGQIDLLLDDGPTRGNQPSTVVGSEHGRLVLHREGVVAWPDLLRAWQGAGGKVVAPRPGTVG